MSLSLVSMYLFMAYTVSRLTKSYFTHIIVEVRDMPKEPFKFWLADKRVHGNVFQRHVNLLMLMRDIANCVFLYLLYTTPMIQTTCIFLVQLVFTALGFFFPPYIKTYENVIFDINNICYLLLDVFFIVNIATINSMSEGVRYGFLGYSMILTVLVLILSNILIGFYFGIKEGCAKRKKKREKARLKKQEALNLANEAKNHKKSFDHSNSMSMLSREEESPNTQSKVNKVHPKERKVSFQDISMKSPNFDNVRKPLTKLHGKHLDSPPTQMNQSQLKSISKSLQSDQTSIQPTADLVVSQRLISSPTRPKAKEGLPAALNDPVSRKPSLNLESPLSRASSQEQGPNSTTKIKKRFKRRVKTKTKSASKSGFENDSPNQ